MTISGVVHSVGYEIKFLAVNPAPIATNPIRKIHLNLLPESILFIKLMYGWHDDVNTRDSDTVKYILRL